MARSCHSLGGDAARHGSGFWSLAQPSVYADGSSVAVQCWQTWLVTPLAYTDLGARIAFYITVGVFVLLEQRTRLRSLLNRHGSRSDQGSLLLVIASVTVGVVAAFLLASDIPGAAITPARWGVFSVGLVLMWAGIALRQWAITLLGRFFTVDVRVQADQTVIERGPYKWVRHPSYSGMVITFLGMGLALGNWLSLVVLALVPTAGLIFRIHVEERTLLNALGEPYRHYAASRRRLFPGLW
jgi:protein-S-isoprenylcysteine O-methyltransferase Ste14